MAWVKVGYRAVWPRQERGREVPSGKRADDDAMTTSLRTKAGLSAHT